ncbi:hypothetical protein BDM02DRAFT_1544475 [Thelephora ganbajun]|uniref:Uncharacterized protein n=1 Tax=Thelephora ganbajun TaxID=370292 RepID=A0ACB6Z140_THEGA|nr:hypothetical protein BDM02DRAFT_1544475 [Thelephora ganbajun]
MLPKLEQRRTAVVHRTRAVQQRSTRIQTSGIFTIPLELFLEVFSYLTDHRRFIRENYYGRRSFAFMEKKHAERSIAIRRLTMTCWPLRNLLLPLLWADVEGCISHTRYDCNTRRGGEGSSLHAQCIYLSLNPAIAAYVRTFSVYLCFWQAPEDLMTKFADCLIQLPNLKTLEILKVSSRAPISKALKRRKYAIFLSVRELRITPACHHFVRNCPNLENLTFTGTLDTYAPVTILLHGKGLKRIAGVSIYCGQGVNAVAWGCPNLREIGSVAVREGAHSEPTAAEASRYP